MSNLNRIIILDEDNTALSPLVAELLLKELSENGINQLKVESVGNVVLFPEPINPKIEIVAESYGVFLDKHVARVIDESYFDEGSIVLALDKESKDKAYANFPNATNVYTLKEFLGSSGDIRLPIGGRLDEYKTVTDVAKGLIENLVQQLKEEL